MSAGLGGAAGPVVEGLDGAGGASEVLETAPGGTAGGGTLYHAHQDVPLPLSGPSQGEGDLGLVRGELPCVQVDMLTRVETTDRRRVVSSGCPGPLHNRLHYRAGGGRGLVTHREDVCGAGSDGCGRPRGVSRHRVRQLHRVEVEPNVADITGTFLNGPLAGPGCRVGRGVAGVPDIGSVPGDCASTGAGGEETAAAKPSSAGA